MKGTKDKPDSLGRLDVREEIQMCIFDGYGGYCGTQGLLHAEQAVHHQATSSALQLQSQCEQLV